MARLLNDAGMAEIARYAGAHSGSGGGRGAAECSAARLGRKPESSSPWVSAAIRWQCLR
jgi:hypothetical protein